MSLLWILLSSQSHVKITVHGISKLASTCRHLEKIVDFEILKLNRFRLNRIYSRAENTTGLQGRSNGPKRVGQNFSCKRNRPSPKTLDQKLKNPISQKIVVFTKQVEENICEAK